MKKQYTALAGALLLSASLFSLPSYGSHDSDPQSQGAIPEDCPLLRSLRTEIDRNMKGLHIDKMAPPCYIDFRLTDLYQINIKAMRGVLVYSDEGHYRQGMPTVLAGTYDSNNLNLVTSYRDIYNYDNYPTGVAWGTNDAVVRTAIWKVLDEKYKNAAERFSNKQGLINQMEIPEEEKNIPDFQQLPASRHILSPEPFEYDREALEKYVTEASKVFEEYKELNESGVRLYAGNSEVNYCNSEGTLCRYPNGFAILIINLRSQSADGQELNQNKGIPYRSLKELPSLEELKSICRAQAELLQRKLASSRITEPYVGPVLFEGEAVADLIERYMADNYKGILSSRKSIATNEMRQYYSNHSALTGNELESMRNKKVISRDLTLASLTGTPEYKGQPLFGHYEVDVQGVKPSKELVLIEDGVLRNMLTTRTPTRFFRESNGHARAPINGGATLLLPGVLRLSSKSPVSSEEMKKKLIAAAREEDYDYAYIVRKMDGDSPSELIRIHVSDGSEELVRGAIIKDMTLRSFKRISAVSGEENIYNRLPNDVKCTYIVPSAMLFDEIEIAKDNKLVLKKNYIVEKP